MPALDIWMKLSCRLSRYDSWMTMRDPNGHQAYWASHLMAPFYHSAKRLVGCWFYVYRCWRKQPYFSQYWETSSSSCSTPKQSRQPAGCLLLLTPCTCVTPHRLHTMAQLTDWGQWGIYDLAKGRAWRARIARAYNGGLGAEPLAGSRGRASGRGSGERSPFKAETLFAFERLIEAANSPIFF